MEQSQKSTKVFSLQHLEASLELQHEFCQEIKTNGFAKIRVTKHFADLFQQCFDFMGMFYSHISNDKSKKSANHQTNSSESSSVSSWGDYSKLATSLLHLYQYDPEKEIGFHKNDSLSKQFFAIRKPSDSNLFAMIPDGFGQRALYLFEQMETLSKTILKFLATAIHVDPTLLVDMCDKDPLPSGTFATSLLHLFHYYGSVNPKPQTEKSLLQNLSCIEHTDSGLLTLIPCTRTPGLQCLNWKTFKWEDVEKDSAPDEVTVLLGETTARLTCNYYQATVHRVANCDISEPRYSIPFQLRGRPDAVIDSLGLQSDVIQVPKSLQEKITIAEFIR